jgi:putative transposase
MARRCRRAIPGIRYRAAQGRNRRQQTFVEAANYALYRDLLAQSAEAAGAENWCRCLTPNHVHIMIVPSDKNGVRRSLADTHRRDTGYINARNRWSGHLWQGRFGAVAMDEEHLAVAVRYVSLNPVRARLVARAQDWRWSSVAAHLAEKDDELVKVAPVLERYGRFADFVDMASDAEQWRRLRMAETSGRPLGSDAWLEALEAQTGRALKPQKRGPKGRNN